MAKAVSNPFVGQTMDDDRVAERQDFVFYNGSPFVWPPSEDFALFGRKPNGRKQVGEYYRRTDFLLEYGSVCHEEAGFFT